MFKELILDVVFAVLFTINIIGNTLIVLIIIKNRDMQTPMNYLLLNLAVADIMVGTFFAPRFLLVQLFTHPTGTVGDFLCKTITDMNLSWVASLVSGFTLVCVAVERFYAVVHPTSFRHKITQRKLKRMVSACWIVATVHTIPSFISNSFDADKKICREMYTEHWHYVTYWFLWLLSAGVVPVSLMTVLYARVIHSLWLQNNGDATRLAVINARKRITRKSITVSVFYALCVIPVHVLYFVSIFHPDVFSQNDTYFRASYCLLVLNSSVNPFVYTLQCATFRKYLKKLVNCGGRVQTYSVEMPSRRKVLPSLYQRRHSKIQFDTFM